MKKLILAAFGITAALTMAAPAEAHFQMLYTSGNTAMEKAEDMDMRIAFAHPAEAGHMMDMGGLKEFYAVYKRGENAPAKIDLKPYLKDISWKTTDSSAPAYAALIPRKEIRSLGDYVFVAVPGYYLEKEEDIYMQQITKLIANVGGAPTIWNEPVGLPCEIVPMIKPYATWKGNVFQGQVLSGGKPVPGAEVEVEFMGHAPDMKTNSFAAKSSVNYPNSSLITQTIIADQNGVFTFGLPKAGWWGFAALGIGPDKEHEGKELSQDAVIWVQASDIDQK